MLDRLLADKTLAEEEHRPARTLASVDVTGVVAVTVADESVPRSGFYLPTGPAKLVRSGTGIPVRFGRKPFGTGGIQI